MQPTTDELFAAWNAADEQWMIAVMREFPRQWPGDVRYTAAARGQPGTPLRAAYEKYAAARDAARKAAGWL